MKTYLVTGGAGFIGSNFIKYILKIHEQIKVINLDCLTYAGNLENLSDASNDKRYFFIKGNICDKELVDTIFQHNNIDYVVNFAAESHVDRSIKNPQIFLKSNVEGTLNLLEMSKKHWSIGEDIYKEGVKYLQVSTDEVYGSLGKEGFFRENTPLDPHSPYSASKTSGDLYVKAYSDTYKLPINITRCSNNYGPYQFPEKLIPLMINNCLNHKELPIYGDGMQIRDWLYVEDHCKAIDLVLENGTVGEIYNIGGHNEKPNIFIVNSIIDYIQKNVDNSISKDLIKHIVDRKGHDRRYGIDPSKIKNDLGWYPETKFEDGIILTIKWYLNNQGWMDRVVSKEYQKYYESMYKNI